MARHVMWDMGGTLIDTYPSIDRLLLKAVREAQATAGTHAPLTSVDTPTRTDIARLTRGGITRAIAILAAQYGIDVEATERAHQAMKDSWRSVAPPPAMAGAAEALAAVRAHGGLNLIVTHRDRTSAQLLLARAGLEVDDMVCQPDGFARKPDPQMFEVMLNRHSLNPSDCLAVGDRIIDAMAAARAGMECVLLETPGLPLEDVHVEAADAGETEEIAHLLATTPRVFHLSDVTSFV